MSEILKVRDFKHRVPAGIDDALYDDVINTCLAVAYLHEKSIDEAKRTATFVFTDPSLDSYKEIIDAGAFDASLAQYMRCPVILPEHRHWIEGVAFCVVGRTLRTFKKRDALLGEVYFSRRPVGEDRWQALLEGCLLAVSVGFRPVNVQRDPDGVLHYTEAKLKEVSTVAVGANDNALLVNYIKAQFEGYAGKVTDAGKARELRAAARELDDEAAIVRGLGGKTHKRNKSTGQAVDRACQLVEAALGAA